MSAGALRESRGAGLALEAAAGTSHHTRAPKERRLSPVQRRSVGHGPTTTSAARRARAASSSAAPPVKTQRAPACATRETRRWLGVGRRSWHVAPRSCAKGERPLVGTAPFHKAQADHNQRGTARARSKFECCAPPRDSQRRRWLGVGRQSWYVASRPLKGRGFLLAQRRCTGYEPTTTRAVRRAGAASSSAALIRKRPLGASPSAARAGIRHHFTLHLLGEIVIPRSGFHRSVGCFDAAAPSRHPQTSWSASVYV